MSGALPFIVRRLLAAIPVLLIVSAATFFLGRYAPGDPITLRAGPRANPEQVERIKQQLGLNDPIPVQYARYMARFLRGDLGESYRRPGLTIKEIIVPKIKVSLELNLWPFVLTYLIGMPLGIYTALRRGRWQDPAIVSVLLFLSSIPVVVTMPLVVYLFSLKLHWLPTSGWHGLFSKSAVLPTIVLTLPGLAGIARVVRISMVQVMGEDFVRTARAKGLPESVVVSRHILRNSLLVIINGVIAGLFFLYAGSFFDLFMAVTMMGAFLFILANLALDILYTVIDPRIRYS
jgi:peptide/nickel transport system permease protein